MPIVNVHMATGHSAAQKTAFLKQASQAIVDSIGAPLPSVRITLHEVPRENVIVGGEIGRETVVLRAYLIHGRTDAQKAAFFAALNKVTKETLDVGDDAVRVIVHDVPNTDMGVQGGISAKAAGR
jgi:4-oxalocrotonate tautomerase family enzyme